MSITLVVLLGLAAIVGLIGLLASYSTGGA
jgi:hypothetical protein